MSPAPPSERFYKPYGVNIEAQDRKTRFAEVNDFVRSRQDGWLTSIPGKRVVTMEVLPGSTIPEELRRMGYALEPDGEGQRLIPHAINQAFAIGMGGELVPLTPGSTLKVTTTMTHAGIVTVQRFKFSLP